MAQYDTSESVKKFYEHFQREAACEFSFVGSNAASKQQTIDFLTLYGQVVQKDIDRLGDKTLIGTERTEIVEKCLAGITRISSDVKDASVYLPIHDQRTYSETLKALRANLDEKSVSFAPKPKFSFKNARKSNSTVPRSNVDQAQDHVPPISYRNTEGDLHAQPQLELSRVDACEESSPQLSNILSNRDSAHIILSSSPNGGTRRLENLRRCVIDMSVSAKSGHPFTSLILKNIKQSLLICGQVSGPIHATNVSESTIAVVGHQFRMHECNGCDLYLHIASRPIVEDCRGIRFAPLPISFIPDTVRHVKNKWDQVDDFKWLKPEASPNWKILPSQQRIEDKTWNDCVSDKQVRDAEDVLREFGITQAP